MPKERQARGGALAGTEWGGSRLRCWVLLGQRLLSLSSPNAKAPWLAVALLLPAGCCVWRTQQRVLYVRPVYTAGWFDHQRHRRRISRGGISRVTDRMTNQNRRFRDKHSMIPERGMATIIVRRSSHSPHYRTLIISSNASQVHGWSGVWCSRLDGVVGLKCVNGSSSQSGSCRSVSCWSPLVL